MVMMLIIFGSVFLTGIFAFFISRKVEHGEAQFRPNGQLQPHESPAREKTGRTVTIKQGSTSDE